MRDRKEGKVGVERPGGNTPAPPPDVCWNELVDSDASHHTGNRGSFFGLSRVGCERREGPSCSRRIDHAWRAGTCRWGGDGEDLHFEGGGRCLVRVVAAGRGDRAGRVSRPPRSFAIDRRDDALLPRREFRVGRRSADVAAPAAPVRTRAAAGAGGGLIPRARLEALAVARTPLAEGALAVGRDARRRGRGRGRARHVFVARPDLLIALKVRRVWAGRRAAVQVAPLQIATRGNSSVLCIEMMAARQQWTPQRSSAGCAPAPAWSFHRPRRARTEEHALQVEP